ncbi:uncharacterized protein LOC115957091 [Quercus lobata]|uniref:uncharacterized protein LOC115957091 n=1 Tax=Quercus lobata TaxID=97700 RepID=UPI001248A442|nr:uncharacterized protein LOC115957091 [Quercus lobata]
MSSASGHNRFDKRDERLEWKDEELEHLRRLVRDSELQARAPGGSRKGEQPSKKKLKYTREPIAFNNDDLEGTIQPHDDVLVVTTRINGFIVKRVLIDQGSGAEVMYLDLYRGLGLKKEDLSKYDTPLMGFDGRMAIPERQITLPVNMEGKEMMVTFIVVASFYPYKAILGRL